MTRSLPLAAPLLLLTAGCINFPDQAFTEEELQEVEEIAEDIERAATSGPSSEGASHWHVPLGVGGRGIAIGNPERWSGLRLNVADHDVDSVEGVNLSVWTWKTPSVQRMDGLHVGLQNKVVEGRGASIGLVGTVGEGSLHGLQAGGLAVVSGSELRGASLGGLATVAGGDVRGLQVGGLASVNGGSQRGIQLGGLAGVNGGNSSGLSAGGLASVVAGDRKGIHVGGLAAVAGGDQDGFSIGGLASVTSGDVKGASIGGLAAIAGGNFDGLAVGGIAAAFGDRFDGVGISGLAVSGGATGNLANPFDRPRTADLDSRASGLLLAGLDVQVGSITGITGALVNRTNVLDGLSFGGFNLVTRRQRGLSIGLFNRTDSLDGLQIGLLNHVASNPPWARWLPILNANF
ncbi:MAG: hypothetical protein AAFR54_09855 [Planctomycetota bacterium]